MDAHTKPQTEAEAQTGDRDEACGPRSSLGDVVAALARQLKELASAAMSEQRAQPAPATAVWRTIKPGAHQRVAIDAHRDDWP
jgi:hypothetical protein